MFPQKASQHGKQIPSQQDQLDQEAIRFREIVGPLLSNDHMKAVTNPAQGSIDAIGKLL